MARTPETLTPRGDGGGGGGAGDGAGGCGGGGGGGGGGGKYLHFSPPKHLRRKPTPS